MCNLKVTTSVKYTPHRCHIYAAYSEHIYIYIPNMGHALFFIRIHASKRTLSIFLMCTYFAQFGFLNVFSKERATFDQYVYDVPRK